MRELDTGHSPGAIILPTREESRFTVFWTSLDKLLVPKGTDLITPIGAHIADNLNNGVRNLKPHHRWIWWLNDDHVFDPGILMRLLDRQVDIVAPVNVKRRQPHTCLVFKEETKEGMIPWKWQDLYPSGIHEVVATGGAGMLIRRGVLDSMTDPWFNNLHSSVDITFCRDARAKGFKVYVDCKETLPHLAIVALRPFVDENGWNIEYSQRFDG